MRKARLRALTLIIRIEMPSIVIKVEMRKARLRALTPLLFHKKGDPLFGRNEESPIEGIDTLQCLECHYLPFPRRNEESPIEGIDTRR